MRKRYSHELSLRYSVGPSPIGTMYDTFRAGYANRRIAARLLRWCSGFALVSKVNMVLSWDSLLRADFVDIVTQYRIGCLASREVRDDRERRLHPGCWAEMSSQQVDRSAPYVFGWLPLCPYGTADDQVLGDLPGLVLERSCRFRRTLPCPDLGPVLMGFFRLTCIEARRCSSVSLWLPV